MYSTKLLEFKIIKVRKYVIDFQIFKIQFSAKQGVEKNFPFIFARRIIFCTFLDSLIPRNFISLYFYSTQLMFFCT